MPTSLQSLLLPELILITVACVLFLVGLSQKASSRRMAAMLAMAALVVVFVIQIARVWGGESATQFDAFGGTAPDGQQHYGTVRSAPLLVVQRWPSGQPYDRHDRNLSVQRPYALPRIHRAYERTDGHRRRRTARVQQLPKD